MAAVPAQTDLDDLDALFDQVSEQAQAAAASAPAIVTSCSEAPAHEATPEDVFQRIGSLTRNLHEALRELGYDKAVENAVGALPDARARLSYIANLTGQAADKVLAAVEHGHSGQAAIEGESKALSAGWDKLMAGRMSPDEFKALAHDSRRFIDAAPARAVATSALFTDIMMAQDFHDLTGQVINRIVTVAQTLEDQLVKLLLEATPADKRPVSGEGFLNGPAMDAANRDDVVNGQAQVDDLLASLGF